MKPQLEDLNTIDKILSQWTEKEEVSKYRERIRDEIKGRAKWKQQFWLAKEDGQVLGVSGLADPLPKLMPLAKTAAPKEIKILYVNREDQHRGVGRKLISFLEEESKRSGCTELLVRSAKRYKDTAWGFYEKIGYEKRGTVESGGSNPKEMSVFGKVL